MARRTGITKNVGKRGVTYTVRWKVPNGVDAFGLTVWRNERKTFPSEKAAQEFQARRRLGLADDPTSAEPLAAYMRRWLRRMERVWKTEATHHRRATSWRLYGEPALGAIPLGELARGHVRAVYDDLGDRGYSHSTIAGLHHCLGRALDMAVADELIAKNPVRGIDLPPPPPKGQQRRYTAEEAVRFAAAVRGDRLEALWLLLLHTGIRIGEALALRWDDLDLDAGRVQIARTQSTARSGATIERPGAKTPTSNRRPTLEPVVIEALRRHRAAQRTERIAAPVWRDRDRVFTTTDGKMLLRANVNRRLVEVEAAAGMPRLTTHGFRHTAATVALEEGVHPAVVKEMLGHASIEVTIDTYSHVSEGLAKAGYAAIGNALRKAEERVKRGSP